MKEYSNEDVEDRIEAIRKAHGQATSADFDLALDCVLRSFGLLGDQDGDRLSGIVEVKVGTTPWMKPYYRNTRR